MIINSKTKVVGILGYPVDHSLSPAIFNYVFQKLNLNWCYLPFPFPSTHKISYFLECFKELNFVGLNVTMPYKEAVVPFLDEVSAFARIAEAVNVIHLQDGALVGYNTDGRGFVDSLKEVEEEGKDKTVVVLGAGGAARSAVLSLAMEGVKKIILVNRTQERGEKLVNLLRLRFPQIEAVAVGLSSEAKPFLAEADILVNATPVGMDGSSLPLDIETLSSLPPSSLVYDMIYSPLETPLLKWAKDTNRRSLNGLPMLLLQAQGSFQVWEGVELELNLLKEAAEFALRGS